jgi:hypothetical protein
MSNLPQIINTPFEITLGENKILVKKATLKDLALLEEYRNKLRADGETDTSTKEMVFSIRLCVAKAYEDSIDKEKITEDYISELIPLSLVNDTEKFYDLMVQLGFMSPTKEMTTEE